MHHFAVCALAGLAALLVGCAPSDEVGGGDTLTRRQRDSVIGASRLPGAQGVRGALSASDSMARRQARLDSLGREP